ncbi:hypothetical protein ASG22_17800 [Chryseobacterium sp. Leaf405]|nr:hypothetical protein ASG22_17800 [Chryseobacterium sp. Leaf405]
MDFIFQVKFYIYLTGGVAAESVLTFMLSGFAIFVVVLSVVEVDTLLEVSTTVESALLVDIDDSFVPQLTANIPTAAINNNFFIIF